MRWPFCTESPSRTSKRPTRPPVFEPMRDSRASIVPLKTSASARSRENCRHPLKPRTSATPSSRISFNGRGISASARPSRAFGGSDPGSSAPPAPVTQEQVALRRPARARSDQRPGRWRAAMRGFGPADTAFDLRPVDEQGRDGVEDLVRQSDVEQAASSGPPSHRPPHPCRSQWG